MHQTDNVNVRSIEKLVSPREIKQEIPVTEETQDFIFESREQIKRILSGEDDRMLAVVGPCSIHDPKMAIDYARRLKEVAEEVKDRIFIVMRVYFEKPRTTVGWKGLINDPHLNDTFDVGSGFRIARKLLVDIAEIGLPAASEALEPITPQYIADLISLASIGARTTESPTHRQMASGLSMPVGYKNGTDGSLQIALDAMTSSGSPHSFLGIDAEGATCVVHSNGNPWGHLILRGGRSGPNYSREDIKDAIAQLEKANLQSNLLVDCSHANSNKDHTQQKNVWRDVLAQRIEGNRSIIGMMLESNIAPGNQKLGSEPSALTYGVSITDACIGWDETADLLREAHAKLSEAAVGAT
ncbi:3-deoxy-7-phosphoheptulonate synthase [Blastopirellula sp. JC732]|uniref:Phospho-2-dehydro-3-deoxyheptonate aldolase n=2 Tax=Blastopirellula sediminis TaxID=2894196 RepID=A0A9X1MLY7_9BACT|nr:3-deoxy-7-phosphoheptulonate synthase [Blastopirellula sediminis]MCC9608896.1 3-deoxy-7-phosphoheptulonate synthase [Blastopirellula sediminis]MCC9628327.1 3-deoxy-7-phosphoheptulonate synthase [Blastopirellula sediminis]